MIQSFVFLTRRLVGTSKVVLRTGLIDRTAGQDRAKFSNGSLGIDLSNSSSAGDGVTTNDTGEPRPSSDVGPMTRTPSMVASPASAARTNSSS